MKRPLRYALWTLGGLAALLLAGVLYLTQRFDPNQYKTTLTALVHDQTRRELTLDGDMRLSFWPSLGVDLGHAALSDTDGAPFAELEQARLSVALLPLLRGKVEVGEVYLRGVQVEIVGGKKAASADAPVDSAPVPAIAPPTFAIPPVVIENASLRYRDAATGSTYSVRSLSWRSSGMQPGDSGDLTLRAEVSKGAQIMGQLALDAKQVRLDGSALSAAMTLGWTQATATVQLESPLALDLSRQTVALSDLKLKLDGGLAQAELAGTVEIDVPAEKVGANLRGQLFSSPLQASASVNGFAKPVIRFDVALDTLDSSRFGAGGGQSDGNGDGAETSDAAPDLSVLRTLDLEGTLRIGKLKAGTIQASDVRLGIRGQDGKINLAPLSAKLYQGKLEGSAQLDARAQPVLRLQQSLQGVQLGPLLQDVAGQDRLVGTGNVSLQLVAQGATVAGVRQSLSGAMKLDVRDGALKGVDLASWIRTARAALGQSGTTQADDQTAHTDFSSLTATFDIRSGVAHNGDLLLKSPLLRVNGQGDIDLAGSRLDYRATTVLVKSLQGQGGEDAPAGLSIPLRISGPFSALQYRLDAQALVTDRVKAKVAEKREELKENLKSQLRDSLKGLFR